MKRNELDDVLYCLGHERRVFRYFKDRYCVEMLNYHMEKIDKKSIAISALKEKTWHVFAAKPIVKNIIKHCGNGYLSKDLLQSYWSSDVLACTLTLDRWGNSNRGYDQTSRNQQNLVLQINFGNEHNEQYQQLLKPRKGCRPFEYQCHPIRQDKHKTLSWVRIDVDLVTAEALIEEIQNDWLRKVRWNMQRIAQCRVSDNTIKPSDFIDGINCNYTAFKYYADVVLAPYKKLWAELSLLAAIQFIRSELGISKIYCHTFETGRKIKKIDGLPPKSMYTKLPKQFGFEITAQAPDFLQQHKQSKRYLKAMKDTRWHLLVL